jgi:ketosteroid isomerase-like protein
VRHGTDLTEDVEWDLIEEGDVVVAEGSMRAQKRNGGAFSLRFCDVFAMQAGKIKWLTSYLMEIK